MAAAYNSPGVVVTESLNPTINATVGAIAPGITIVGPAQGFQTNVDRLIAASGTQNLTQTGIITSSVTVTDVTSGNLIVNHGAYAITQTSNPDGLANSGDETYSFTFVLNPVIAPNLALGTGSNSGVYEYAVSFLNANGETGIGPISATINLTNQGVNLSNIPTGPAGTTGRNIYRSKVVNGVPGSFHLVATISDNTTTTLNNEATTDGTAATNPLPQNGIVSGDSLLVQYNYTNVAYYQPMLFTNYSDVVNMYGAPFDVNGNISSILSFGIRLAFLNGASEVIGLATPTNDVTGFTTAMNALLNDRDVRMIAPLSGDPNVHSIVQAHCAQSYTNGLYRMAVVGRDSSTTPIAVSTLRTYAQSILQEYMICISPSSFSYTNPVSLVPYPVGAQYMAAAVLGMYAARDVSVPLTRKLPAGFQGPYEARSINDAALDSAAGLFVVDNYLGNLRCRHSVTTLPNDPNKRESSVVRAKYEMALQLKYALDQSVVGVVISNEEIPTVISSAVSGILAQLVTLNIIDSYQGVLVQQNANDPTIVNVQFMYAPLYPINQIQVVFTINTSNGDFTLTQT